MNKTQLAAVVAARAGLTGGQATLAVNAALEIIQAAVAAGDKVSLTGFGAFDAVHRAARTGRNPSTGAKIAIAESWSPKFRAGSEFKDAVASCGRVAVSA